MPMHDWTRVSAGTFHAFHNAWITHIQESLNGGLLPDPYYALGEQRSGDIGPDVLTLKTSSEADGQDTVASSDFPDSASSLVAVAESPPQVHLSQEAAEDIAFYLQRQRAVVVRHASGDRVVALVEIVSPANRHSLQTLDDFVDKVVAALREGIIPLPLEETYSQSWAGVPRRWQRVIEGE